MTTPTHGHDPNDEAGVVLEPDCGPCLRAAALQRPPSTDKSKRPGQDKPNEQAKPARAPRCQDSSSEIRSIESDMVDVLSCSSKARHWHDPALFCTDVQLRGPTPRPFLAGVCFRESHRNPTKTSDFGSTTLLRIKRLAAPKQQVQGQQRP